MEQVARLSPPADRACPNPDPDLLTRLEFKRNRHTTFRPPMRLRGDPDRDVANSNPGINRYGARRQDLGKFAELEFDRFQTLWPAAVTCDRLRDALVRADVALAVTLIVAHRVPLKNVLGAPGRASTSLRVWGRRVKVAREMAIDIYGSGGQAHEMDLLDNYLELSKLLKSLRLDRLSTLVGGRDQIVTQSAEPRDSGALGRTSYRKPFVLIRSAIGAD